MEKLKLVWLVVIIATTCAVRQSQGVPVYKRAQRSVEARPNSVDRIRHDDVPNVEEDLAIGGADDSPGVDVNAESQTTQDDLQASDDDLDQTQLQPHLAVDDTDQDLDIDHADAFEDQDEGGSLTDSSDSHALPEMDEHVDGDDRLTLGDDGSHTDHGGAHGGDAGSHTGPGGAHVDDGSHTDQGGAHGGGGDQAIVGSDNDVEIEVHHEGGDQGQSGSLQIGRVSARRDLDQFSKDNTTDNGHFLFTERENHSTNDSHESSSANAVHVNSGFLFDRHHDGHTQEPGSAEQVTIPGVSDREQLNESVAATTRRVDIDNEGHSLNNTEPNNSEHMNGGSDLIHGHDVSSGDQPQTGPEHAAGGQVSHDGGYVIHEGSGSHLPGDSQGGIEIDKDGGSRNNRGGNHSPTSFNSQLISTTSIAVNTEPVTPKLAILPTPAQIDGGETQTTTPHSSIEGHGEVHSSGDGTEESSGHSGSSPEANRPETPGEGHIISGEGQIGTGGEGHESQGHEGVIEGSGTDVEHGGSMGSKEPGKDEHESSSSSLPVEHFISIVPIYHSDAVSSSHITLFPSSFQNFDVTPSTPDLSVRTTSTKFSSSFEFVTSLYLPESFSATEPLSQKETTSVMWPDYIQSSLTKSVSVNQETTEIKEISPPSHQTSLTSSQSSVLVPGVPVYESMSMSTVSESSSIPELTVSSRSSISPSSVNSFTSQSSSPNTEETSLSTSSVTSSQTSQDMSPNLLTTTPSTTNSTNTTSSSTTNRLTDTSLSKSSVLTTMFVTYTTRENTSVTEGSTPRVVSHAETTTRRSTTGSTTGSTRRSSISTTHSPATSRSPATVRMSVLTFPVTKKQTFPIVSTTPFGTTKKHATHKATEKPEEITTTGRPLIPTTLPLTNPATSPSPASFPETTLRPFTTGSSAVTVKPQGPVTTPPPLFIQIEIRMTWQEFCSKKTTFKAGLREIIRTEKQVIIRDRQIRIPNLPIQHCSMANSFTAIEETVNSILVQMYLVDEAGKIDTQLTIDAYSVIGKGFEDTPFKDKIVGVRVIQEKTNIHQHTPDSETHTSQRESGITMVIVIASVGGLCCLMLIMLQVVLIHRRVKTKAKMRAAVKRSPRSNDNVALGAISKSRPHSGYWNPALEEDDDISLEYSHMLNYSALANFCMDKNAIYEEFQNIPCENSGLTKLFVGENDKNRFANVLPHSHSRVRLKMRGGDTTDYVNASYIKGYRGSTDTYIATQSPLVNTVEDFWRMVWEQQSRTIIMLNPTLPSGKFKQSTCYWPNNEASDSMREYGDFTVALKKKDVQRDYIECVLEIKDIERNLMRDVHHFLLTCWPDTGIPEPLSMVKFVLDTRPHYEDCDAPPIVHCGPGTGRTGALIAIDICMRMYEARKHVDFLSCVTRMRKDRLGMVQSKEQYAFIYQALNEYAVILGSPSISTRSSVITLHAML